MRSLIFPNLALKNGFGYNKGAMETSVLIRAFKTDGFSNCDTRTI